MTSPSDGDDPVAAYKRLLKTYLDRRPSGTRQRIAQALGTHKSFVSQIANPAYRVPLPAQHVRTILRICHFSPEEERAFLAAYARAHPSPEPLAAPAPTPRVLRIELPDLGDPVRQRKLAETIEELAERIIALARRDEP